MLPVLLDTNIIIDFDKGSGKVFSHLLRERGEGRVELLTSVLTHYEYFVGVTTKDQLALAEMRFRYLRVLSLTPAISQRATQLAEKLPNYQDFDLLIAATALEHGCQIATLNLKHFQTIPGLKIWKPDL